MHFALVVFPQFEVLDAFGPTEVLHCLGTPTNYPNSQNIRLSIIGPALTPISSGPTEGEPSPIKSRVSQTIVPTHTFDDPPEDVEVLIVPGGFGAGPKALYAGEWEPPIVGRIVQFLRDQYPKLKYLLSKLNDAILGLSVLVGAATDKRPNDSGMQRRRTCCSGWNSRWSTGDDQQATMESHHRPRSKDTLDRPS